MARMPGVRWEGEHAPVQANGQRLLMTRYDIVCVHTIVGQAPAHAAHFSTWADGTILQSRDTLYRSGANLEGNHRVIAIENADMPPTWNTADGHAVPAMTAAQVEACARIAAWAHQTHGIPLVANPNSRPTSRGIGYHRQGIDGNWSGYAYGGRVTGGESWTTSPGKVCPGDRRIKQTLEQIIPRAIAIAAGGGDDDMTPEEHNWLARLSFGMDNGGATPFSQQGEITDRLRTVDARLISVEAIVRRVDAATTLQADDEANILAAIEAAKVDPVELAAELAPLIVAQLPDPTTLTEQQMQDALLAALTGQPLIPTPPTP